MKSGKGKMGKNHGLMAGDRAIGPRSFFIFPFPFFIFLAGCARIPAEPPASPPPPAQAAAIPVGPPERVALSRRVEQPGAIVAFAQTPLLAKVPGYVKAVHVDI